MYETCGSSSGWTVYFLIPVLFIGLATASPVVAQSPGDVGVNARVNMRGMPMAGVDYSAGDRLDVRLLAGYFRGESQDFPVCADYCVPFEYTVHKYAAALSGLYHLKSWKILALQGGAEVGYLLAHAPNRLEEGYVLDQRSGEWNAKSSLDKTNDRVSFSFIAGLSARPLPWLAVFLEGGFGYDRGMPRQEDRFPRFVLSESTWGFTHISPGLRILL